MKPKIIIEVEVHQPKAKVWQHWVGPDHIVNWNFASEEWCCPKAENNLVDGGKFSYRMEAKDGSMGFDFWGIYQEIVPENHLEIRLGDDRMVWVSFEDSEKGTLITETFEIEDENSPDLQRQGWQNILNNFKSHSENN